MQPRPYWLIASTVLAMLAFTLSTQSPLALAALAAYGLALLVPTKMPRDSANIWGLRLLIYALGAAIGRSASGPLFYYDARAFLTVGLILGGEIALQTVREPPRGLRYDPFIVLLSGLIFLIACNTLGAHIFLMAPPYVFCLVMALGQVREGARSGRIALTARLGIVAIAVMLGAGLHSTLWLNRSNIMALGSRLLSGGDYQNGAGNADMGENPEMSSSFAQGASTSRLIRVTGNLGDAHLRGAAFDLYNRGTWGPALSLRAIGNALPRDTKENVGGGNSAVARTDVSATLTMLRPSNKVLYAPLNVAALVPAGGQSFEWARYAGPLKAADDAIPVTYSIINGDARIGGLETTQGPLCVAPDADQLKLLTTVPPEVDPKVSEIARDTTRDAPAPLDKIRAIEAYLLANHAYSLDFARGPGDPVSEFLLSKKSAHCQYFAASAVMLMRASGVPARYVSGFYAHETEDDGSLIVRGRDAHAWAEAWVQNVGWVTVDATPPAGRADPKANPLPWYQKSLEAAQDTFSRVRAWFSRLTTAQILGLMAIMLVVWGIERWRQNWRRSVLAARASQVPQELAPLAKRFERALTKRGIVLTPGQPWSEALPPDWEREARWVELYNRLRFARADTADIGALAEELSALEREKPKD